MDFSSPLGITAAGVNAAAGLGNFLFGSRNRDTTTTTTGTNSTQTTDESEGTTGTVVGTARRGRTTDSGKTTTTANDFNRDALNRVMQDMLEGNSGLAAILGQGEQGAGMYGSTNAALLTNDLMARVAGEIGKLTSTQTTTVGPSETTLEEDNLSATHTRMEGRRSGTSDTQSQQTQQQSGGGKKGICFITTAVCDTLGYPDHCEELTVLRKFRDTWLKENHPEQIDHYKLAAPVIVSYIDKLPNAAAVYKHMLFNYIYPAVQCIQRKKFKKAYGLYSEMFLVSLIIILGTKK